MEAIGAKDSDQLTSQELDQAGKQLNKAGTGLDRSQGQLDGMNKELAGLLSQLGGLSRDDGDNKLLPETSDNLSQADSALADLLKLIDGDSGSGAGEDDADTARLRALLEDASDELKNLTHRHNDIDQPGFDEIISGFKETGDDDLDKLRQLT